MGNKAFSLGTPAKNIPWQETCTLLSRLVLLCTALRSWQSLFLALWPNLQVYVGLRPQEPHSNCKMDQHEPLYYQRRDLYWEQLQPAEPNKEFINKLIWRNWVTEKMEFSVWEDYTLPNETYSPCWSLTISFFRSIISRQPSGWNCPMSPV